MFKVPTLRGSCSHDLMHMGRISNVKKNLRPGMQRTEMSGSPTTGDLVGESSEAALVPTGTESDLGVSDSARSDKIMKRGNKGNKGNFFRPGGDKPASTLGNDTPAPVVTPPVVSRRS